MAWNGDGLYTELEFSATGRIGFVPAPAADPKETAMGFWNRWLVSGGTSRSVDDLND